jgi:hypothetical protein
VTEYMRVGDEYLPVETTDRHGIPYTARSTQTAETEKTATPTFPQYMPPQQPATSTVPAQFGISCKVDIVSSQRLLVVSPEPHPH